MFNYKDIYKNKELIKDYTLNSNITLICNNCNNVFERKKRHILASINNNTLDSYCCKLNKKKQKTSVDVTCLNCNIIFSKYKTEIIKSNNHFCCQECHREHKKEKHGHGITNTICKWCKISIVKSNYDIKRSKNIFCSRSCASKHKRKNNIGKRSKIETYFEMRLSEDFPLLDIQYNTRSVVDYELDIFVPSLNLGIEINGPFHYSPVFGFENLNTVIFRDIYKKCRCDDKGITLEIIDISTIKNFTSEIMEKYYISLRNLVMNYGIH